MTDPAGGAPTPQGPGNWQTPPTPPPAGAPTPQSPGNWQTPPTPPPAAFQAAPQAAGPAPGVVYADVIPRIIALFVDGIILFVGLVVVSIVLAILGGWIAFLLVGVIYLVASAAYFVYTWTTMRATYGQKFLGLETVNAADGATLTRDQAIKRWAYMWGPAAVAQIFGYSGGILLGVIGSLLSLVALVYELYLLYTVTQSPKRQGFHDVQAGTVVVKRVA